MKFSRSVAGICAGIATMALTVTSAFAGTNTVTVQPGQTLWTLSQNYGVSLQSIESANPSVNASDLLVGTQLQLPSGNQASTSHSNSTLTSAYDTSSNLYWMEHVIHAEAGGESLQTQIAVGDVIMHRLEAGTYGGNTVYDVVFQVTNGAYQFSSVPNGYIYSTPNSSSIQAAENVLQTGTDEVPGAMVFYNPSQTPSGSWVWSQPTITQIGHLVFAK